ncbi:MAG: hypothetical protein QM820_31470 [Minicystis sp.]
MNGNGQVQIVHALPHRVHLRAPRLAGHRGALERAARALAERGALAKVTARPVTGSVIVEDEDRTLDPAEPVRLLDALVREARDDDGQPIPELKPEEHPGPTRIARAVAHAAAGINADIRVALDDRADLGTLLPVFFASAGIAEVAATRKLPVPTWFNLLWWSLRSFMTFNIRAVEEEVENGRNGHKVGSL